MKLLFLDESGHHGLKTKDQEYPILLLCGCILDEEYFVNEFSAKINRLKQKYFQTTRVILHSRDIRKWQHDFKILGDIQIRHEFYKDIDAVIGRSDFTIVAAGILKEKLLEEYGPRADNPYNLCLPFILERAAFYLDRFSDEKVTIIAESRGKKEDATLQHQFQVTASHGTKHVDAEKFSEKIANFQFTKKSENNVGTQLCDLVAYPIATKVLYPDRENLAFGVIEPKLYRQFPDGDYLGYGLKLFP